MNKQQFIQFAHGLFGLNKDMTAHIYNALARDGHDFIPDERSAMAWFDEIERLVKEYDPTFGTFCDMEWYVVSYLTHLQNTLGLTDHSEASAVYEQQAIEVGMYALFCATKKKPIPNPYLLAHQRLTHDPSVCRWLYPISVSLNEEAMQLVIEERKFEPMIHGLMSDSKSDDRAQAIAHEVARLLDSEGHGHFNSLLIDACKMNRYDGYEVIPTANAEENAIDYIKRNNTRRYMYQLAEYAISMGGDVTAFERRNEAIHGIYKDDAMELLKQKAEARGYLAVVQALEGIN